MAKDVNQHNATAARVLRKRKATKVKEELGRAAYQKSDISQQPLDDSRLLPSLVALHRQEDHVNLEVNKQERSSNHVAEHTMHQGADLQSTCRTWFQSTSSTRELPLHAPNLDAATILPPSIAPALSLPAREGRAGLSTARGPPFKYVCLQDIEYNNSEFERPESPHSNPANFLDFDSATVQSGPTDLEGRKAAKILARIIQQNQGQR